MQTLLRSQVTVAVAVARGNCSDWTPSQRTSICHGCSPKKTKKKKKIVFLVCPEIFLKCMTGEFLLWLSGNDLTIAIRKRIPSLASLSG